MEKYFLKNIIKYLVISDIHLGHLQNKTSRIINNLIQYFKDNNKLFSKLDMIFIAGDVFERLLGSNSDDLNKSLEWLAILSNYCKKNNIKLRILEGTPSHDWKQVKLFKTTIEKMGIEIDFKYVETLHIERVEDLGLDILYVPDEWTNSPEKTFQEVEALLALNNIEKVDIAIMHGMFKHQLPFDLPGAHDEDSYLNIVRHFINIGHIHSSSVFGRILAQGSFDRLSHGEEEAKGGMVVTLTNASKPEFVFIENKNAAIFKTIKLTTKEIGKAVSEIKAITKQYNAGEHIRIMFEEDNILRHSFKEIEKQFPMFVMKDDVKKNKDTKEIAKIDVDLNLECFSITPDNIIKLMDERMAKYSLRKPEREIYLEELKSVLV